MKSLLLAMMALPLLAAQPTCAGVPLTDVQLDVVSGGCVADGCGFFAPTPGSPQWAQQGEFYDFVGSAWTLGEGASNIWTTFAPAANCCHDLALPLIVLSH